MLTRSRNPREPGNAGESKVTLRPGSALRIRDAVPEDYPEIKELLLAGYAEFSSIIPARIFDSYIGDILDLDRRAEEADLLVAETDTRVVGTVTYYPDASVQGLAWPSGWVGVRTLAVSPQARGLGIGRRLMVDCLRRARAQQAPIICLHTADFMTAAISIYESLGFQRASLFDVDVSEHYDANDAQRLRIIAYLKPVHPRAVVPEASARRKR